MNTRELAIVTWLLIIIICFLLSSRFRPMLWGVVHALLKIAVEPAFVLIFIYQSIIIAGIILFILKYNLTLWIVKDYLIVFFTMVITFLGESKSKNFFSSLIHSLGFGAIFQFFISTYTFDYWKEMFIVFVTVVVSTLLVVNEKHNSPVKNLLNGFLLIMMFLIMTILIYKIVKDIAQLGNLNYWEGYFVEPVSWLINIPLIIFAIPLYQYDILDNFRTIKKTPLGLLGRTIIFGIEWLLNSWLKFTHVRQLVSDVHQGGFYQAKFQIYLKGNVTNKQVKQITRLYKYMLAPAKDYKNQKKKIPIRIECRHEETHQLIGDTYEMSYLKEIYKQPGN